MISMVEIWERLHPLAKNPELFEKELNIVLEQFLENYPEEQRLRMERRLWSERNKLRKYKDPIVRANKSLEYMMNSLLQLRQELSKL